MLTHRVDDDAHYDEVERRICFLAATGYSGAGRWGILWGTRESSYPAKVGGYGQVGDGGEGRLYGC